MFTRISWRRLDSFWRKFDEMMAEFHHVIEAPTRDADELHISAAGGHIEIWGPFLSLKINGRSVRFRNL